MQAILIPFQIAACASITLYLAYCCIELHVRNQRSWQTILARLSPEWTEHSPSSLPLNPKALFRDAAVLIEIADYAEQHASRIPPDSIASLRNDALEIRVAACRTLVRQFYPRPR